MTNTAFQESKGKQAEALAEHYLAEKGLVLIKRNFRLKIGEIDLIMQDGDTLVFIEVRYRKNNYFGGAIASVDARKQKKLARTAEYYLVYNRKYAKMPSRFDVVAVSDTIECTYSQQLDFQREKNSSEKSIEWIKNAFEV